VVATRARLTVKSWNAFSILIVGAEAGQRGTATLEKRASLHDLRWG